MGWALDLRNLYITKERVGQSLMNHLRIARPLLYEQLTGLPEDCFYEDAKVSEAMLWIETHWHPNDEDAR